MNQLTNHEKINTYINEVCSQIKARELHAEIRLELESHLQDILDDYAAQGMNEEDAIQKALEQMGNSTTVGQQLHQVHKPKTEWSIVAAILIFVALGLLAMLSLDSANLSVSLSQVHFFEHKAFYTGSGLILMIGLYFLDYRKFVKLSWPISTLAVTLMLAVIFYGAQLNGQQKWLGFGAFYFDITMVSTILLIIAFAAMMSNKLDTIKGFGTLFLFLTIPALLFFTAHTSIPLALYYFTIILMVTFGQRSWKVTSFTLVYPALMLALVLLANVDQREFTLYRLKAFFTPSMASQDARYATEHSMQAIQSAGWWGQGLHAEPLELASLHNELILSYLVYSFGWMFGITLVLLSFYFLRRISLMLKQLADPFAKRLVLGLLGILTVHFMWNILMTIGLMPMTSVTLPFVSYSGTNYVLELGIVGLLLSVYRRKNMIPRQVTAG
ncbi:FtsW/RodA/SpoVE family cell cycle protein [Paenibacillus sp. GCM10023252]|uniref:FtsW/RodA/SpoVE family cell cycle protein n=1 Tax=Paenibacillus sp. GCM10023252 TaxID=3252649 RepID=UPI00360A7591